METKNREKLLLIATGACIALWLLDLLVISPLIDGWHGRSDEIDKLKKNIADGTVLIQRGSTIRGRWDFMRANALNSDPTVAERQLFTAFDHWVNMGGVTQGSFRPQVQDSDTNFLTVDCRSDVSGNHNNVSDFLRAMSQDPLANKLDSVVLSAKDDNGQQLTLDLSMSGLVLTDSIPSMPVTGDSTPPARDTNSLSSAESEAFKLIARNNIFDQSRRPGEVANTGPRVRPPSVSTFTLCGAAVDNGKGSASFVGSGASSSQIYTVGESINNFKITKITLNNVTLTGASTNVFVVPVGTSMRREGEGPWRLSAELAAASATDTISTSSDSSVPAPAAGTESIQEKMRKRREQEEK